jgi:hypothetical protein
MVNIKGKDYKLIKTKGAFQYDDCNLANGEMDFIKKQIKVNCCQEYAIEISETLTHEIIHAFLKECGLERYSNDETLVEWFAMTFDEIIECRNKAIKELKIGGKN